MQEFSDNADGLDGPDEPQLPSLVELGEAVDEWVRRRPDNPAIRLAGERVALGLHAWAMNGTPPPTIAADVAALQQALGR